MQVNGMRVRRQIHDFHSSVVAEARGLGHRRIPTLAVEQRRERPALSHALVERQRTSHRRRAERKEIGQPRRERTRIGPGKRHDAELHDRSGRLRVRFLAFRIGRRAVFARVTVAPGASPPKSTTSSARSPGARRATPSRPAPAASHRRLRSARAAAHRKAADRRARIRPVQEPQAILPRSTFIYGHSLPLTAIA